MLSWLGPVFFGKIKIRERGENRGRGRGKGNTEREAKGTLRGSERGTD